MIHMSPKVWRNHTYAKDNHRISEATERHKAFISNIDNRG